MACHESMKLLGSMLWGRGFPSSSKFYQKESHKAPTGKIRKNVRESFHEGAVWLRKIALTVKSTQTPFLYL